MNAALGLGIHDCSASKHAQSGIDIPQLVTVYRKGARIEDLLGPYESIGECCAIPTSRTSEVALYATNGTVAALKDVLQKGGLAPKSLPALVNGRSAELESYLSAFYPGKEFCGWMDNLIERGSVKLPNDYAKIAGLLGVYDRMDDFLRQHYHGADFDVRLQFTKENGMTLPQKYPKLAQDIGLETITFFTQKDPKLAEMIGFAKDNSYCALPKATSSGKMVPGAWVLYAPKHSLCSTRVKEYLKKVVPQRLF